MRKSFQGLTFIERVNLGCALKGHIMALGDMVRYGFGNTKRNIKVCAELYARVHQVEPHNNEKLIAARSRHMRLHYAERRKTLRPQEEAKVIAARLAWWKRNRDK